MTATSAQARADFNATPSHLRFGLALVLMAWGVSWMGPEPARHYTFFPLWLGYVLVVDGITAIRSGTSLLTRSRGGFVTLFAVSVPLWWGFEAANARLQNWVYILPQSYSWLGYHVLASIAFSTVAPAIFATAELVRTFKVVERVGNGPVLAPSRAGQVALMVLGLGMMTAALVFPKPAFPLIWIGAFLVLDPLNEILGRRSLSQAVRRGDWRPVISLAAAGLVCGFFWEMWNSNAMPKWTYDVPYVGFGKVFEMPILGYGGYIPFSFEVFAFVMLVAPLTRWWRDEEPVWMNGQDTEN